MALKALLASLDGLDEPTQKLYKKTDDGFVLDVDDEPVTKKLSEFRTNNRKLNKDLEDRDTLLAQLEWTKDLNPEEVKEALELRTRFSQDEELKLMKEGKDGIEKVLARRTERLKAEYDQQIKALKDQLKRSDTVAGSYKTKLEKMVLDVAITDAVNKVAVVRKSAMGDVLNRARSTFSINENAEIIAVSPGGQKTFAKDGETPITVDEWVASLVKDADHLFEPAQGGGAGGNKGANDNRNNQTVTVQNDPVAMGRMVKDIAAGKVKVMKQ